MAFIMLVFIGFKHTYPDCSSESAGESLNAFANGLLSIFSCVTCIDEVIISII